MDYEMKATPAVFDASKLEVTDDASAEIEIYDGSGAGTGIFITVVSSENEEIVKLKRGMMDRRLTRMRRQGGRAQLSTAEIEVEAMEVRIACTKSWRDMYWKGEKLECSPENKRMIYTRAPLIRAQVDDAIADAALFTTG